MSSSEHQAETLLEDAIFAYNEGRFSDAFPVFEELAETGNVEATCGLADMYLRGEGVGKDVENGLRLLRCAVDLGHANAAFNLGALHRTGADGVPIDISLSKKFFLRAKELGCELPVDKYL